MDSVYQSLPRRRCGCLFLPRLHEVRSRLRSPLLPPFRPVDSPARCAHRDTPVASSGESVFLPDLDTAGSAHSRAWAVSYVRTPAAYHQQTVPAAARAHWIPATDHLSSADEVAPPIHQRLSASLCQFWCNHGITGTIGD